MDFWPAFGVALAGVFAVGLALSTGLAAGLTTVLPGVLLPGVLLAALPGALPAGRGGGLAARRADWAGDEALLGTVLALLGGPARADDGMARAKARRCAC